MWGHKCFQLLLINSTYRVPAAVRKWHWDTLQNPCFLLHWPRNRCEISTLQRVVQNEALHAREYFQPMILSSFCQLIKIIKKNHSKSTHLNSQTPLNLALYILLNPCLRVLSPHSSKLCLLWMSNTYLGGSKSNLCLSRGTCSFICNIVAHLACVQKPHKLWMYSRYEDKIIQIFKTLFCG